MTTEIANAMAKLVQAVRYDLISSLNEQLEAVTPNQREDPKGFNGRLGIAVDHAMITGDGTVVMGRKITCSPRAREFPALKALIDAATSAVREMPRGEARVALEDAIAKFRY